MNEKIKNLLFFIISSVIGLFFIHAIENTNDTTIEILLYPQKIAVELFYNIRLIYVANIGYCSENNSFAVSRECMGYRFIALTFVMLNFSFTEKFKGVKNKTIWLLLSSIIAIVIGTIITGIRIVGSIPIIGYKSFGAIHSGIGITIHLVTSIVLYNIIKFFLKDGECNE